MHWERSGRVSQARTVTNSPNIPIRERFINSKPFPVGSWKAKVNEEERLPEDSRVLGLRSQWGAANRSLPTNTGFRRSSLKSIFGVASVPVVVLCSQMPLTKMAWYPAIGAALQLGPNLSKKMELYFEISPKLMMLLKVRMKFL